MSHIRVCVSARAQYFLLVLSCNERRAEKVIGVLPYHSVESV